MEEQAEAALIRASLIGGRITDRVKAIKEVDAITFVEMLEVLFIIL